MSSELPDMLSFEPDPPQPATAATASPAEGALSVAAYSQQLGRALRRVGGAVIEGEVQRPRFSSGGMLWFDLTDGTATLSCKVFRQEAARLGHQPRDGDRVRVKVTRADLWASAGKLDLIVSQVTLAGEGELLARRAALVDRLAAAGLCDPARRRPLPRFPRTVGVIAGRDSDAMSDVIQALSDRWPGVSMLTRPCAVQGAGAPGRLIDALAELCAQPGVDVIVLARGGGSVSDLACFDDESLCLALSACPLPVVCAIGHTDNNPVCNHVAWAAFTPSRAAELVVPSLEQVRSQVTHMVERLDRVPRRLELAAAQVSSGSLAGALDRFLLAREHTIAQHADRLSGVVDRGMERAQRDVALHAGLIAARDFRDRGWMLAQTAAGEPVRCIADLSAGDRIDLILGDGRAAAVISSTTPTVRR